MATIIRNAGPIADDAFLVQAELFADNYWGGITNERMFVIPFWKVTQMLGASASDEIALRVTNIDDPSIMSASWVVFEQSMADALRDPIEMGVRYYVMDDSFFYGPILTSTPPITQMDGIRSITATPHNNVLRARIGQSPADGEFIAFFLAAECVIIDQGGGGGGALSGAKVPTGGGT